MNRRPSFVLNANRELIREIVRRHHAANARVFGSASRGTDTESSDLDILVDPLPGATLIDIGAIQAELELALGISVDLVTPRELPARMRDYVLLHAVPI